MTKINTITDAFITKIQALYDIEKTLEKALPKMAKKVFDPELKSGLKKHFEETLMQSRRLEEIFALLNIKPKKLKAEGVRGIIDDAKWVMEQKATPELKDAMIASAGRYAEHYEIGGYMGAIEMSMMLGEHTITELLMETLEEEKNADQKLAEVMRSNLRLI